MFYIQKYKIFVLEIKVGQNMTSHLCKGTHIFVKLGSVPGFLGGICIPLH